MVNSVHFLRCHNCGISLIPAASNIELPLFTYRNTCVDTQAQAEVIRSHIDLLDADIASVDASLVALDAARSQLRRRREELETTRQRKSALLAPIRRLPPELVVEIFDQCFVGAGERDWLLTLGHICSAWRDIVIHTPHLWTELFIKERPKLIRNIWMPRSANLLLTMYIMLGAWDDEGYGVRSDSEAVDIIDALSAVSERWRTVEFDLRPVHMDWLRSKSLRLPNLESLSLDGLRMNEWHPSRIFDAFKITPRLRDITLNHIPWNVLELPRSQLAEITLQCNVANFLDVLFRCHASNLVDAQVTGPAPNVSVIQTTVQNTSLEILSIKSLQKDVLAVLLATLVLPRLEFLSVSCSSSAPEVWNIRYFLAFVRRSQCTLETLSLGLLDIPDEEVVECLTAIPTLVNLYLIDVIVGTGERLFTQLKSLHSTICSGRSGPTCIVPSLLSFTLRATLDAHLLDQDALAGMIQSRVGLHDGQINGASDRHVCRRLQALSVESESPMDHLTDHFDAWRRDGLVVDFRLWVE